MNIEYKEKIMSLITKYDLGLPVNIKKLANKLGLNVSYSKELSDDISGEIHLQSKLIYINKNHSKTRMRFTLAHEIGHYFNDSDVQSVIIDTNNVIHRRDGNWNFREYRANNFAAELLMPYELMIKEGDKILPQVAKIDGKPSRRDFIKQMAKKFNVSEQSMKYRLQNTELFIKPEPVNQ